MTENGNTKPGKIVIPDGLLPAAHELLTADFFARLGKDVTFLMPDTHNGAKTADIVVDRLAWEIKASQAAGKRTIENLLRAALKQSPNIVIDLRRTKMRQDRCINEITKQFNLTKKIKRLIIVKKDGDSLVLKH